MSAAIVGAVMRRVVVNYFNIGDQSSARISALDQVMAEQRIAREAFLQNLTKRIDIVNPFAGKDALAIKILVNIGNRPRVDIKPSLAGINACQPGACRGVDTDADARLHNPVAPRDNVQLRIDQGAVQGMSNGANQALRGAAWKLRVGIERQNISDEWQARQITSFHREGIVSLPQHLIQVKKLAAFALPTHPGTLARIVNAMPVK